MGLGTRAYCMYFIPVPPCPKEARAWWIRWAELLLIGKNACSNRTRCLREDQIRLRLWYQAAQKDPHPDFLYRIKGHGILRYQQYLLSCFPSEGMLYTVYLVRTPFLGMDPFGNTSFLALFFLLEEGTRFWVNGFVSVSLFLFFAKIWCLSTGRLSWFKHVQTEKRGKDHAMEPIAIVTDPETGVWHDPIKNMRIYINNNIYILTCIYSLVTTCNFSCTVLWDYITIDYIDTDCVFQLHVKAWLAESIQLQSLQSYTR